ncbi:MAG: hypothetical protein EBR86_02320 [Planctomycetia bacterium]|nr:hypothetical protein [Planctomycetia bacterium]
MPTRDGRRHLRRLATRITGKARRGGDLRRLEAAVAEALEAIARLPAGAERWTTTEAVAWALGWTAQPGGASTGRTGAATALIDQLCRVAAPAVDVVRDGDTAAAACLLVVAELFPDIAACQALEPPAREAVEAEIDRQTSDDGAIRAPGAADVAARVALVARWAAIGEAVTAAGGGVPWNARTDARLRAAGETALALMGPAGSDPRGPVARRSAGGTAAMADVEPLLDRVARDGSRRARNTARHLAQGGAGGRLLPRERGLGDGGQAVIRSGWDGSAVRLFIDWQASAPWLEVAVGRRVLVAGPWSAGVSVGGQKRDPDGPWRMSSCEPCRHGTFLEIVQPLVGGGEVQRQVVVMAADRVVLLADAVIVPASGGGIDYRARIVLPGAITVATPEEETRERLLCDGRPRSVVLPLALGEWTSAGGPGSFDVVAPSSATQEAAGVAGLELRQSGPGDRLYAPLWIDCDPGRSRGPVTWRQLTVADTRRILGRHEAVGFRVQAGLEQWLVYRALDEPRNRTLLGCNVACELILGRIKPRGRVGRSIEIE